MSHTEFNLQFVPSRTIWDWEFGSLRAERGAGMRPPCLPDLQLLQPCQCAEGQDLVCQWPYSDEADALQLREPMRGIRRQGHHQLDTTEYRAKADHDTWKQPFHHFNQ